MTSDQPRSVTADDAMMVDDVSGDTWMRTTWLSYQGAALIAFVVFALTVIRPIEIGAAVAGAGLLLASRIFRPWSRGGSRRLIAGLSITALLIAVGLAMWWERPTIAITAIVILPIALAVGFLAWRGRVDRPVIRSVGLALLIVTAATVGVLWINVLETPEIDALNLHVAAAESLLEGKNPYTEARAANTNPFGPPGAEFTGYPYPPLAMVAYAGAEIVAGDARWASVLAVAAVITLLIRPWVVMTRAQAAGAMALGLAMVVQPALGTVFRQGWTDPLALPFLLGVALLWRRNPVLSAVLLGLAFGSKQYFILGLPVLLAWSDEFRWRRFWIASGVAALVVIPGALLNPTAFWEATIGPSIDAPIRLDSSGLAGLGLETPFIVVVLLSVAAAVWMSRKAGESSRFLLAIGATLAVAFLFGSQAFINYWFFVGTLGLIAVGAALAASDIERDMESRQSASSTATREALPDRSS